MTKHRPLLLILGLLATSVALCAFYPQSYLDGNPKSGTDAHLANLSPVQIISVDNVRPHDSPVAIAPGPHWLEIQTLPDVAGTVLGDTRDPTTYRGTGPREQATQSRSTFATNRRQAIQKFVLKIEPCTRYYLGAHKDSAASEKWKLVIDEVEDVKGCDPAEELKKFPDPSLRTDPKAPAAH